MKKRLLISLALLFSLTSCGFIVNEQEPHVPGIPEDDPADPTDPVEPVDPVDPVDPQKDNYIELTDNNKYYYVGETFANVSRLSMKLHRNGTVTDISNRLTGYSIDLADGSGNPVDAIKPFTKAGNYSFNVYLTNSPEIMSNDVQITVKPSPTKELKTKETIPDGFSYYDFENSCLSNLSFPNKGTINALVIPVEIKDYPFSSVGYGSKYLSKINAAFNGNGKTDTKYWESVSSYYQKSSLGNLNFNFEIAEVFVSNYTSETLLNTGIYSTLSIVETAVNNYKNNHGVQSTKKFDNDGDGYIDGVWMVYSAPNYSTGVYGGHPGSDVFWAFCTDRTDLESNINSPVPHSFGWASIDFLQREENAEMVDAHTFIHETGHLLGLPDFYNYDNTGVSSSGAQGGLAMMDLNIGDQDSFSKLSLGWANPYYASEDCIVKLKPNSSSGDCLILADNWNGTAFDEYIILDLVTPAGINELDSQSPYTDGRPLYYTEAGVRAYHIDARLGEFKYNYGVQPYKSSAQDDYYLLDSQVERLVESGSVPTMSLDMTISLSERTSGYTVINANSPSRALINDTLYTNNRLISIIGANNLQSEINDSYSNNDFLFKKNDSWTANAKTSKFFPKDIGTFNNGDSFSYAFTILDCSEDEATIQIRKVK